MESEQAPASTAVPASDAVATPAPQPQRRSVLRNTAILLVGQVVTVPLTVLLNVVMARYLGAADFGYVYLGTALATFGMLLVEWGQSGTLPALVVAAPSRSGVLLGTGLAYRSVAAVVVFIVIAAGCHLAGYDTRFQIVFALCTLGWTIGTLSAAGQDVIRGYERTDVTAYAGFAQQALNLILVLPILWMGGTLVPVLAAQALAPLIVAVIVVRGLRQVGVGKLAYDRATLVSLMRLGTPFFTLGLAIALQPNVDAVLLSKLAPIEAVGWYAVARKLVNLLGAPAH
jgi:O-antigen/teichoic acid export membrane protein